MGQIRRKLKRDLPSWVFPLVAVCMVGMGLTLEYMDYRQCQVYKVMQSPPAKEVARCKTLEHWWIND